MVKGISKQVIVVNSPDHKMFDQAIFILSDTAIRGEGITDAMLMQEAKNLIHKRESNRVFLGTKNIFLVLCGALLTGFVWFMTAIL